MSSSPKEPSKAEIVKLLREARTLLADMLLCLEGEGGKLTAAEHETFDAKRERLKNTANALESSLREQGAPYPNRQYCLTCDSLPADECEARGHVIREPLIREQGGPSFEEKVDKAVVAVWGPYAEAAGMDFCRTMMRRVLKATGVEGD